MSGHSKWSKVKHQKASTDAVKSQAFTKASRAITVAVREGGGIADPEKNYHLRLAIEKARQVNMPKDTIDRAIDRGLAGGENALESVLYEGYGPGGVAIVIEAATDNRARTVSEIKNILERSGGRLAGEGAVNFLFARVGEIIISKESVSADQIMEIAISVGADDVHESGSVFVLTAKIPSFALVKEKLEAAGVPVVQAGLVFKPVSPVTGDAKVIEATGRLMGQLEELDDVQKVYTNLIG